MTGGRACRPPPDLAGAGRVESVRSVLVAGCGTSQAVRHALRHPAARVVGIDVSARASSTRGHSPRGTRSPTSSCTRSASRPSTGSANGSTTSSAPGSCTTSPIPRLGLRRLREVLAPGGAVTLMVYARYGRAGVYLLQDYCRRLGMGTSDDELAELVATLREMPARAPAEPAAARVARLRRRRRARRRPVQPARPRLLRARAARAARRRRTAVRPLGAPGAIPAATAVRSARPRTPRGSPRFPPPSSTPLVELFRGTMTRHTAIVFAADDATVGRARLHRPGRRSLGPRSRYRPRSPSRSACRPAPPRR